MSAPELGQLAVAFAEGEANAGAREVDGNNAGPFVEKYLNADRPDGSVRYRGLSWCVGFFLWCWIQACRLSERPMPFRFTLSSGTLLDLFRSRGWYAPLRQEDAAPLPTPRPGDAVFWDFSGNGEPDHVNMVHHLNSDRVLYTIGGNEGTEASGAPVQVKRRGRLDELAPRLIGFGLMFRASP